MEEEPSPDKGVGLCENQVQSKDDEKIVGVTERILVAEPKPNQSKNAATVKENKAKTGKEKCRRNRKGQCIKECGHAGKCKIVKENQFWRFSGNLKIQALKEREENVKRKRIEEEYQEVEKIRLIGDGVLQEITELKEKCATDNAKLEEVKVKLTEEKSLFERQKSGISEEISNLKDDLEKGKLQELKKEIKDYKLRRQSVTK